MSVDDFWVEQFPDDARDVFAGRDLARQFGNFVIQEAVIHAIHDFALEDVFQLFQVENHASHGIRFAGNRDFENVIVSVAVRIIALAKNPAVLLIRKFRIVVEVSRGEFDFACDADVGHVRAYLPDIFFPSKQSNRALSSSTKQLVPCRRDLLLASNIG